jgi:hypothetical protein
MAEDNSQQVAVREQRPLAEAGFTFLPKSYEELWSYAKEVSNTDFVPRALRGQPGAVLAAWQTGKEVGLPPMASLQSIAIINGRPSIHSNGYWALLTSHPLCEWFKETPPDEALQQGFGECTIKRKGNPHVITRRFTMEEAKTAQLLGKDNWKNYPGDMLQNRARHRAGDDAIPEACQGLLPSDIARDLEPVDVTPEPERKQITQPQPLKKESENAKDNGDGKQGPENLPDDTGVPVEAKEEAKPAQTTETKAEEKPKKVANGKGKAKDEATTSKVGKVGSGAPETERAEAPTSEAAADEPEFPDWLAEGTKEEKDLYQWVVSCPHAEITEQINAFTKSFNSIAKERQLAFLRIYNDRRQGKA